MRLKRTMLFLLALFSTEALVLALSSAAYHLGLSDFPNEALLLVAIVAVTSALWLKVQPAPDRRLVIAAFVVPIAAVVILSPLGAVLAIAFQFLGDGRVWTTVLPLLSVGGVAVSATVLRRDIQCWRLVALVAMALCSLIVLLPDTMAPVTDIMTGITFPLDLGMAVAFGLLGGLAIGVWAAAMHPLVTQRPATMADPLDRG